MYMYIFIYTVHRYTYTCEDGAGESHSVALLLIPRDGYSFIAVIYVRVHVYTSDTYSNTSTHTSDILTAKPVIYVLSQ